MKNIVLIGFMGVQRDTRKRDGRKNQYQRYRYGWSNREPYQYQNQKDLRQKGKAYFRQLEQRTANWLTNGVTNSIISTGGGFYKVKNLKDIGTVVYLQADFDWIYERITKSSFCSLLKRLTLRMLHQVTSPSIWASELQGASKKTLSNQPGHAL